MNIDFYNTNTIAKAYASNDMKPHSSYRFSPEKINWRGKIKPAAIIYDGWNDEIYTDFDKFNKDKERVWWDAQTKTVRWKRYITIELVNQNSYTHYYENEEDFDNAANFLKTFLTDI